MFRQVYYVDVQVSECFTELRSSLTEAAKLLCFDNDAFTIIHFLLGHKIKISMYFK